MSLICCVKQIAAQCVECDPIFEGRGESLSPPPLSLCEHRTQSGRIHPDNLWM